MKRLLQALVTFFLILLFSSSCYYNNEEALYPSLNSSCDTTNVTFSREIATILANNCLSCHSNTTAASSGNSIRLQDYPDVKSRITSIEGAIKHTGAFSPMPKNRRKLNDCAITMVDIWIRKGTLND